MVAVDDLLVVLAWLGFGAVGYILADRKRRHAVGWGVASFLFPPVLLILLALPPRETV